MLIDGIISRLCIWRAGEDAETVRDCVTPLGLDVWGKKAVPPADGGGFDRLRISTAQMQNFYFNYRQAYIDNLQTCLRVLPVERLLVPY